MKSNFFGLLFLVIIFFEYFFEGKYFFETFFEHFSDMVDEDNEDNDNEDNDNKDSDMPCLRSLYVSYV